MERDRRQIEMSEMMTPDKANFAGKIHGGHIMNLLDKVAYACAARYAGAYCVTLSVDQIIFKQPIFVGELVTCLAMVNYVGHTSMEIGIKVLAEDIASGAVRHTNTCYFTMVAMDESGKPKAVPTLKLRNDTERYRHQEAELRRKLRRAYADEHAAHKHNKPSA